MCRSFQNLHKYCAQNENFAFYHPSATTTSCVWNRLSRTVWRKLSWKLVLQWETRLCFPHLWLLRRNGAIPGGRLSDSIHSRWWQHYLITIGRLAWYNDPVIVLDAQYTVECDWLKHIAESAVHWAVRSFPQWTQTGGWLAGVMLCYVYCVAVLMQSIIANCTHPSTA